MQYMLVKWFPLVPVTPKALYVPREVKPKVMPYMLVKWFSLVPVTPKAL